MFDIILLILIVALYVIGVIYFIVILEHRHRKKLSILVAIALFSSITVYYIIGNWQLLLKEGLSSVDTSFENLSRDEQTKILELSKEKFEEKLNNNTLNPEEYISLAQVYFLLEEESLAKEVLLTAKARDISDSEIFRFLARLSQTSDTKLSQASWQDLLHLVPDDFEALYYLGLYELSNNNISLAKDYFQRAKEVIPANLSQGEITGLKERIESILTEMNNIE